MQRPGLEIAMFEIVLYRPEIPPNTGNVIRLCANTGCRLHLVGTLGFVLDDARLRRAGLDYHELTRVRCHPDLEAFRAALPAPRMWAFTTRASRRYTEAAFRPGDILLFGPETSGLPGEVLETVTPAQRLRLPMAAGNRSLNLSNAVAVAVYEAWRQQDFEGAS